MIDDGTEMLDAVRDIEAILHKRVERPGTPDEDEAYDRLRRQLIRHAELRKRLPDLIRDSSTLSNVWPALSKFDSWKSRREFITKGLKPARDWLEGWEQEPASTEEVSTLPEPRAILHTLRGLLEANGKRDLAALLVDVSATIGVRNGDGTLRLLVPINRIHEFTDDRRRRILDDARRVMPPGVNCYLKRLEVDPALEGPPDESEPLPGPTWKPERVTQHDGLWFRSKTEIRVYDAFKKRAVFFFVNATGVLGGRVSGTGRPELREPDFLVCLDGKWGIFEVMGSDFHTAQNASKDHDRARLFKDYGILMIEFYDAAQCYKDPDRVVDAFLRLLSKS